ncbi:MAG: hypothetical protein ACREPY_07925, partial [Rhodanobacteraceae bacterium]
AAASLKHVHNCTWSTTGRTFPRRYRRGPIEALLQPRGVGLTPRFPRRYRRGLIEAIPSGQRGEPIQHALGMA